MKKIFVMVGIILSCCMYADDKKPECYGQNSDGSWYAGQYRGTERTYNGNQSTTTSASSSSSDSGKSSGSLGTSTYLSGDKERSESKSSSANQTKGYGSNEKQVCVPNAIINQYEK